MPCAKFIVAFIISIATVSFSIITLAIKGFNNTAETAFCTSIITTNLSYWVDAPSYNGNKKNEETLPLNR